MEASVLGILLLDIWTPDRVLGTDSLTVTPMLPDMGVSETKWLMILKAPEEI